MQQVAHIFSRIERSKIYQFGSFSLRSFYKSELNFASSFASKLRKFAPLKRSQFATIFPSRRRKYNWKSRKVLRDLASKYCTDIDSIPAQNPYDFCFNIVTILKQNMCNLRPYLNQDHHIIRAKLMPSSSVILTLLRVKICDRYDSYPRQKLAQFWPGFDANNGINFYQATA